MTCVPLPECYLITRWLRQRRIYVDKRRKLNTIRQKMESSFHHLTSDPPSPRRCVCVSVCVFTFLSSSLLYSPRFSIGPPLRFKTSLHAPTICRNSSWWSSWVALITSSLSFICRAFHLWFWHLLFAHLQLVSWATLLSFGFWIVCVPPSSILHQRAFYYSMLVRAHISNETAQQQ